MFCPLVLKGIFTNFLRKNHSPIYLNGVYARVDVLLGGGLREGQLTEIVGPSSSGKTQVASWASFGCDEFCIRW